MKLPESNVRYIDRPEISETFVDSIGLCIFDGNSVRAELCVDRLDKPKPPKQTARRYPACRLVLSPDAAVDLFNSLSNIINLMQQKGLVSQVAPIETKGPQH